MSEEGLRICSFLPAATEMVYDLGLQAQLGAVTFECPAVAQDKPKVFRYAHEGKALYSQTIDDMFTTYKGEGRSPYWVDEAVLQAAAPDVVLLQNTCEVCQIDTRAVLTALEKLPKRSKLLELSPNTLADVEACLRRVGKSLGAANKAEEEVTKSRSTRQQIQQRLQAAARPPREMALLEWIDPLYTCGHWIPDQITAAGGSDKLASAGDSCRLGWTELQAYDPEVLVLASCGHGLECGLLDLPALQCQAGWQQLRAVRCGEVYVADFAFFTQPSLSSLTVGVELLAACLHPDLFSAPRAAAGKYVRLDTSQLHTSLVV